MNGADEYYDLFKGKSQQIGRLFMRCSRHARGRCFEIYVLPEGVEVKGKFIGDAISAVEVYGMISGRRGRTESYGWVHKGKWQDDFSEMILSKKEEGDAERFKYNEDVRAAEIEKKAKVNSLLSSYG